MATRTVSVVVEVQVSDDKADVTTIREDLKDRARRAVEASPHVRQVWFASTILRKAE